MLSSTTEWSRDISAQDVNLSSVKWTNTADSTSNLYGQRKDGNLNIDRTFLPVDSTKKKKKKKKKTVKKLQMVFHSSIYFRIFLSR